MGLFQRHRRSLQRCSNFRRAPYFALHKGIAIGFLKAIGFRNKPKRTIFCFWCGDPTSKHDLAAENENVANVINAFPSDLEGLHLADSQEEQAGQASLN